MPSDSPSLNAIPNVGKEAAEDITAKRGMLKRRETGTGGRWQGPIMKDACASRRHIERGADPTGPAPCPNSLSPLLAVSSSQTEDRKATDHSENRTRLRNSRTFDQSIEAGRGICRLVSAREAK